MLDLLLTKTAALSAEQDRDSRLSKELRLSEMSDDALLALVKTARDVSDTESNRSAKADQTHIDLRQFMKKEDAALVSKHLGHKVMAFSPATRSAIHGGLWFGAPGAMIGAAHGAASQAGGLSPKMDGKYRAKAQHLIEKARKMEGSAKYAFAEAMAAQQGPPAPAMAPPPVAQDLPPEDIGAAVGAALKAIRNKETEEQVVQQDAAMQDQAAAQMMQQPNLPPTFPPGQEPMPPTQGPPPGPPQGGPPPGQAKQAFFLPTKEAGFLSGVGDALTFDRIRRGIDVIGQGRKEIVEGKRLSGGLLTKFLPSFLGREAKGAKVLANGKALASEGWKGVGRGVLESGAAYGVPIGAGVGITAMANSHAKNKRLREELRTKQAGLGSTVGLNALSGGIWGAGTGALGGAIHGDKGDKLHSAGRGALMGGAIGAGLGAATGGLAHRLNTGVGGTGTAATLLGTSLANFPAGYIAGAVPAHTRKKERVEDRLVERVRDEMATAKEAFAKTALSPALLRRAYVAAQDGSRALRAGAQHVGLQSNGFNNAIALDNASKLRGAQAATFANGVVNNTKRSPTTAIPGAITDALKGAREARKFAPSNTGPIADMARKAFPG